MRYSDMSCEQADLRLCCLHGHMIAVGLFDFMLSDHGKQLRSCRGGQLSLLHIPGQGRWPRGRASDSGSRGPGFDPQGHQSTG